MSGTEDLGKAFVARVLAEGPRAFAKAKARNVEPGDLVSSAQVAWQAVVDYQTKHRSLPNADYVRMRTGIVLPSPDMTTPLEVFVSDLFNDALLRHLGNGVDATLRAAHSDKDGRKLYAELEALLKKYRSKSMESQQVFTMADLAPRVEEHYARMERGERGVLAPWTTMNDATLGWWPEDLILFAARMAVGKTWMMILLMLHAWRMGHKVLFASTEMSLLKLAMRFCAIEMQLDYKLFSRGQLPEEDKKRFLRMLEELRDTKGIGFVEGGFDYTPAALHAAIDLEEPKLVVGDGAYLMKAPGKDRSERAANAFNELKVVAQKAKIPLIISSQFNRDAVKGSQGNKAKTKGTADKSSLRLDNLALTDVAGWNTDVVYALHQTPEMRQDCRMEATCLKLREGEPKDVLMEWDLAKMRFGEISETVGDLPEDLGTGVPEESDHMDGTGIPF